ncbi:MAG: YhjD/YihY/BrkB family envelope integrity protein [Candidatus Limnocylindria bacterium]
MTELAPGAPSRNSRLLRALQFAVMIGEGFVRDHLLLRATALSYFTVLSLIPLLAVVISIVGSVGIGGDFADMIVRQIAAGNPEAQAGILTRIRDVNFAGLGTLGAAVLLVTTVLCISTVEADLNAIWGVRQQRTLTRRFADYLAVLVVGPLLLATALSLATTLQSQWLVQRLIEYRFFSLVYDLGLQQAPTVVLAVAFSFLYWFLPNTPVRPFAALLGGAVAGVLVVLAQGIYLSLVVGSARYDAIFGGFAALPLLFVWIYLFWAMVLFGAEVAFAYDNLPLYRREVRGRAASPADNEAIGLRIALEVARGFRDAAPAWTADALAEVLDVPVRTVRAVLVDLERAGVVTARGAVEEEGGYQLGRPAESIPVTTVVRALRGVREKARGDPGVSSAVDGVLGELEAGAEKGAAGRSLADLLASLPARGPRPA